MRMAKAAKILTLIGVVLVSGTLFFLPAKASVIKKEPAPPNNYCKPSLLKDIGEIDGSQTANINRVSNPIYCTFKDKAKAIADLKKKTPEILAEISKKLSIEPLNITNWRLYRNGLYELPKESTFYDDKNIQNLTLKQFFDIYENYDDNEKILHKLEKIKYRLTRLTSKEKNELGNMLPDYAPLAQESQRPSKASRQINTSPRIALPNVDAAVSYAQIYSTTPNRDAYGYVKTWNGLNADCTNFASQIVHAAGVGQIYYNSAEQGWWHRKNGNNHTYSTSWQRADTFARYMGVMYTNVNHTNFARNIQRGDLIAADFSWDGNWDHMGFVTRRLNYEQTFPNGTYYNYVVAQHSNDYLRWASITLWPSITVNGGRLARIRR